MFLVKILVMLMEILLVIGKERSLIRSGDCHEKNANDRIIWQVAGNKKDGIILIGKWQVNMESVMIIW